MLSDGLDARWPGCRSPSRDSQHGRSGVRPSRPRIAGDLEARARPSAARTLLVDRPCAVSWLGQSRLPRGSMRCCCNGDASPLTPLPSFLAYRVPRGGPCGSAVIPSHRYLPMTRRLRIAHVAPPLERVPPARLRRHRADRLRAGRRARPPRPRRDDLRERRFGRPGRLIPTVRARAPPDRLHGRADALHARDDAGGPRPRDRVRHHPRPPRVGQPDARARVPGPGRLDLPRPARPAVGGRGPARSAARPRRDQRQPGIDAPGRALDGDPQRPDPRRRAVRAPARRRAVLRRPRRAREGHRRGDRDREAGRPPAAHRRQGGPGRARARVLRGGVRAGARGGRVGRRVPRRARPRPIATACSPRATPR